LACDQCIRSVLPCQPSPRMCSLLVYVNEPVVSVLDLPNLLSGPLCFLDCCVKCRCPQCARLGSEQIVLDGEELDDHIPLDVHVSALLACSKPIMVSGCCQHLDDTSILEHRVEQIEECEEERKRVHQEEACIV